MHRRSVTGAALAALLAVPLLLAGQEKPGSGGVRPPEEPSAPAVDIARKTMPDRAGIPATVEIAGGEKMTGVPDFPFDSLEVEVVEGGRPRMMAVPLAGIDSIEFIRWAGKERRKNEFAFYPAGARIILADKKVIECGRNIPALNRITLRSEKGRRYLYAYFFDYREKGAWRNSGSADMAYPETSPPAGTLVRIVFTRKEEFNPLEKLFRIIQGERK